MRAYLIELAVEQDDDVMEKFLDGEEPDVETLQRLIRMGTLNMSFVPVLCGSAFKNKGVQPMLAIRTALLEAMSELPAQPEHLKRSGIGRIVMKMANNKQETRDNRTMARNLVEAWARPVVGKVGEVVGQRGVLLRHRGFELGAALDEEEGLEAGVALRNLDVVWPPLRHREGLLGSDRVVAVALVRPHHLDAAGHLVDVQ